MPQADDSQVTAGNNKKKISLKKNKKCNHSSLQWKEGEIYSDGKTLYTAETWSHKNSEQSALQL